MLWARLPMGMTVAGLFGLGAYRVSTTSDSWDGAAMMAVSLVLTGIWIVVELHDKWHGDL